MPLSVCFDELALIFPDSEAELTASLNLLGKVAWMRLDNDQVRFTIVPEQGTQVWAVLSIDSIFNDDYTIQSAAENNTINLEVPLGPLNRALKSAQNSYSASIRLTKKDNAPLLSLTIVIPTPVVSGRALSHVDGQSQHHSDESALAGTGSRETTITQDVAVRVLPAATVEGIHEPRSPDPEVHILLPPLLQLKAVSERFTKLALAPSRGNTTISTRGSTYASQNATQPGLQGGTGSGPRLEIAANMHGELRIGVRSDALNVQSKWSGLSNPELDPNQVEGGAAGLADHPSTRMRRLQGEESWAVVRVEGKDWGRVLGVGRMGGRVVACFCHDRALILYVYLPSDELGGGEESVLTYYITSYAA